jgi:plastocyanin
MNKLFLLVVSLFIVITATTVAGEEYRQIEVRNGGAIHGTVSLSGQPPAPETVAVSSDAAACGKNKSLESVIVGPNGGLKNVIVSLEGITQGKKMPAQVTAEMDQEKCEYAPHIVVLPKGATLNIVNSDPVMHNVHAYDLTRVTKDEPTPPTLFNIAIPVKGMKIAKAIPQAGLYRFLCDAGHPWMNAYVLVTEHPYFAVTDEKGQYTIDNIPAGTYTLRVWHEGLCKIHLATKSYAPGKPFDESRKVTVTSGGRLQQDFKLDVRQAERTEAKLTSH